MSLWETGNPAQDAATERYLQEIQDHKDAEADFWHGYMTDEEIAAIPEETSES